MRRGRPCPGPRDGVGAGAGVWLRQRADGGGVLEPETPSPHRSAAHGTGTSTAPRRAPPRGNAAPRRTASEAARPHARQHQDIQCMHTQHSPRLNSAPTGRREQWKQTDTGAETMAVQRTRPDGLRAPTNGARRGSTQLPSTTTERSGDGLGKNLNEPPRPKPTSTTELTAAAPPYYHPKFITTSERGAGTRNQF